MLYGQDMGDTVTPLEAGLDRFVNLDKDFLGVESAASAGREAGLSGASRGSPSRVDLRRDTGMRCGRGWMDEESVITSGAYSPVTRLQRGTGVSAD